MDQSNVKMLMPSPVDVPNKELRTTLFGAIQHTQLKTLRPVQRKPGTKYHAKLHAIMIARNFSREMWRGSGLPYVL